MQVNLEPTFNFLKKLAKNNNMAWFHAHRDEYSAARAPFELLVEEVILGFNRYEDLGGVQPRDCIYRINRDLRFSPDKTPYKIYMSAVIARGGRKSERAAYYLHLQPGESFIGGGIYMPEPDRLLQIRRAIADDHKSLQRILNSSAFKKNFKGLETQEMLKTAPKGFPADHPAIDLLRLKHFTTGRRLTDKEVLTPNFQAEVIRLFRAMKPLNDWLNEALGL